MPNFNTSKVRLEGAPRAPDRLHDAAFQYLKGAIGSGRCVAVTGRTRRYFNTSKVRLEDQWSALYSFAYNVFQYLKGAIGSDGAEVAAVVGSGFQYLKGAIGSSAIG